MTTQDDTEEQAIQRVVAALAALEDDDGDDVSPDDAVRATTFLSASGMIDAAGDATPLPSPPKYARYAVDNSTEKKILTAFISGRPLGDLKAAAHQMAFPIIRSRLRAGGQSGSVRQSKNGILTGIRHHNHTKTWKPT